MTKQQEEIEEYLQGRWQELGSAKIAMGWVTSLFIAHLEPGAGRTRLLEWSRKHVAALYAE